MNLSQKLTTAFDSEGGTAHLTSREVGILLDLIDASYVAARSLREDLVRDIILALDPVFEDIYAPDPELPKIRINIQPAALS